MAYGFLIKTNEKRNMSMKSNLFTLLSIPELPTNRKYWIVRSNGGM